MSFATSGMGTSNQQLEYRIADLERSLSEFDRFFVIVDIPGGGKQTVEVIARRGSSEEVSVTASSWQIIITKNEDGTFTWEVSPTDSTVQDGTNGPLIDLAGGLEPPWKVGGIKFEVPTVITVDSYISLKAAVDPTTLVLSDWELVAEVAEPVEVEFDTFTPFGQIFTRLRIGKIVFSGSPSTPKITEQYATTRQCIVRLFLNGKAAKGFSTI